MRTAIGTFAVLVLAAGLEQHAKASEFVHIPGGEFRSVIPEAEGDNRVTVADFLIQEAPVTNAEFLRFVLHQPVWQRGAAVSLFVDDQYLSTWAGPISLGSLSGLQQPVIQVSWFAANAYCEWQDARLPGWYEWEYVAAANDNMADARALPEWRQEILSWYSQAGGERLDDVRNSPANYYGVFDTHGLVWEWVDDFSGFMVSGDNREQGGADKLQFCGAGAITMEEKENYAVLMRVAMLSALEARYTTRNLGFRCARTAVVGQ
jgi:formylglycine-generating enzyme required for sulfatase activity